VADDCPPHPVTTTLVRSLKLAASRTWDAAFFYLLSFSLSVGAAQAVARGRLPVTGIVLSSVFLVNLAGGSDARGVYKMLTSECFSGNQPRERHAICHRRRHGHK
jgi:hypothetical protein